jgi:hypothetical protein
MLAYWIVAALVEAGTIAVPKAWMYPSFEDPMIVAWNWSFFPLDVLFAVSGLLALYGPWPRARSRLLLASLVLMFCAGLMAISFWAIRGEFDPTWWGANLWLMALPILVSFRWRGLRDEAGGFEPA